MAQTTQTQPARKTTPRKTPAKAPAKAEPKQRSKLAIICSKGSMDMAYPPFILGQAAALMDYEVHLFFTFWGMDIVHKKKVHKLKATPVGNPAAHMATWVGAVPGMSAMMTGMMKKQIAALKIPPIPQMIKDAQDLGVQLHACSTSMEMFKMTEADLVEGVDVVGAASFLAMSEGGQTLFI